MAKLDSNTTLVKVKCGGETVAVAFNLKFKYNTC